MGIMFVYDAHSCVFRLPVMTFCDQSRIYTCWVAPQTFIILTKRFLLSIHPPTHSHSLTLFLPLLSHIPPPTLPFSLPPPFLSLIPLPLFFPLPPPPPSLSLPLFFSDQGEIWLGAENQEDCSEWVEVLRDAGKV